MKGAIMPVYLGVFMPRKRYTDKFRATAVVMLEAQGYPDVKGALSKVAKHLDTPPSTLKGWWTAEHNPAPTQLRDEKKSDLAALIKNEVEEVLNTMPDKRVEADYRALSTALGIMVDKLQLLTGEPTERKEVKQELSQEELNERIRAVISEVTD